MMHLTMFTENEAYCMASGTESRVNLHKHCHSWTQNWAKAEDSVSRAARMQ